MHTSSTEHLDSDSAGLSPDRIAADWAQLEIGAQHYADVETGV